MGAKFTINNFSVVVPIFNEEEILLDSCNKIFEICNDSAKIDGTTAICEYKHPDVWEPTFIARMEINMDKGNKRKFIYFQIE